MWKRSSAYFSDSLNRALPWWWSSHDLDFIANADYVIDMGPQGGKAGGRIVACGTPEEIVANRESITGGYLEI